MEKIVGLIGEKGSGKEEFTNTLRIIAPEKRIERFRSGDILAETLALWGLDKTRENFNRLAVSMDETYGNGTLSHAVYARIVAHAADVAVFDGMRWDTDVEIVRSFSLHVLVYITADIHTRYERVRKRKEKVGEEFLTFEQFQLEEILPTEREIGHLGTMAHFHIVNNGSREELAQKVGIFYERYLK